MDCIFDQSYRVGGEDMPIKLNFSQVIFVMEDVDAATSVVLKRTSKQKEEERELEAEEELARSHEREKEDKQLALLMAMMVSPGAAGGAATGGRWSDRFHATGWPWRLEN
eukprot:SAG31_NODE_370_length_16651_cov_3.511056_11_plen_110_part_00